jgi:rhodanese-related sulfurtransferase
MANPSFQQPLSQVTVKELAQKLAACEDLQLIDVRESWEVETAGLPGFMVLPLSEYAEWSGDIQARLDPYKETLVLCHHGMRSAQMCQWLIQQGFTQVKNIAGGIDAYAIAIDHSVPRY